MKRIIARIIFYGTWITIPCVLFGFLGIGIYLDYQKHGWSGPAGILAGMIALLVSAFLISFVLVWADENK